MIIMEQQQQIGNKWSQIAQDLTGRTENQVKNRFKSLMKKGMSGCPRGLNPIAHLLGKTKTDSVAISNGKTVDSPLVASSVTPSTHMSHSVHDLGFSNWAEQFKLLVKSPTTSEATPSPSNMLFFHKDK